MSSIFVKYLIFWMCIHNILQILYFFYFCGIIISSSLIGEKTVIRRSQHVYSTNVLDWKFSSGDGTENYWRDFSNKKSKLSPKTNRERIGRNGNTLLQPFKQKCIWRQPFSRKHWLCKSLMFFPFAIYGKGVFIAFFMQ